MYTLAKLVKRRYLIVMTYAKLCKSRRSVLVVYAANLGDDKPCAALCTLFVIVHQLLGCAAVKLSEPHQHRGHNYAVFDFTRAYLHR